ncbi:cyanophycinase [Congregibacter litoralis]|uniref:Cyanophycinase n=1 Tax=Congregibacter litoralis KT71 TaxID=314285 RepID=A4AE06_9GAMM|nr:cyanophycinase [Congregibacter litoralis]EAQ95754.1 cyanophycinase [Congregibacter litoralis KT71]
MPFDSTDKASSDRAGPSGSLALIGGRFEADNAALYKALHRRCDGRIAVCSMASGYPEEVGAETVDEFRAQGFYAELVPIFFENREESAFDPRLIERLQAFGSVFFTGGDQSRIVGTLVQDGRETPALEAIRALYASGGLIAGSSAGAAIMSGPMIMGGTSLNAISRGIDTRETATDDFDAFRLGKGLGFFDWGMVDQHFLQRGRVGRLIKAAELSGESLAFGIDENSALIVQGSHGEVVGETGILFIDLRKAIFGDAEFAVRNARVSFLDDGDAIDLRRGKPLPAADKRRARVGRASYRSPAPVRRNAFASYGLHDLMLRLIESDPAFYSKDSASAFDALFANQVTLHIERRPRRSRALRAVRAGEIRYTALNFNLDIHCATLDACPLNESTQVLRPDPAPEARLVMLGSTPINWSSDARRTLLSELREPVGVLATASGEPTAMAERYLDWLASENIQAELLPISLHNIERASRDRALLKTIDRMGSLLLTGGDQRRVTEALLHCAEATPVLHSIVTAYERGTPLIAVAASATALGNRMIAEGDSVAAWRYGSSEDASFSGVVVERGIGLTRLGLIDQNFLRRHRLGRLLIACAAQQQRFGFGLCEGAGMIIHGNEQTIEAIGSKGVVVAELDLDRVRLAPKVPDPSGVRLYLLEPGQRVRLEDLAGATAEHSAAATALLRETLDDLARDYQIALGDSERSFNAPRWLQTLGNSNNLH